MVDLIKTTITADDRAKNEYKRLRDLSIVIDQTKCSPAHLISCCNVRSLKKHITDITSDIDFLNSDIILCTETQISTQDVSKPVIEGFNSFFKNSEHKHSSLAIYCKNDYSLNVEFSLEGISIISIIYWYAN